MHQRRHVPLSERSDRDGNFDNRPQRFNQGREFADDGVVADKRCAVDLVFRVGEQSFELIELKVESDTPLRAAVEIVQYGLLYALARDRYPETQHASKDLLRAKDVHLRVLAPTNYYAPYTLAWLEHDLDVGLRSFALEQFGMPLLASFSFHAFPKDFCWPCPENVLHEHVRQRRRMWLA